MGRFLGARFFKDEPGVDSSFAICSGVGNLSSDE